MKICRGSGLVQLVYTLTKGTVLPMNLVEYVYLLVILSGLNGSFKITISHQTDF